MCVQDLYLDVAKFNEVQGLTHSTVNRSTPSLAEKPVVWDSDCYNFHGVGLGLGLGLGFMCFIIVSVSLAYKHIFAVKCWFVCGCCDTLNKAHTNAAVRHSF